MRRCRRPLRRAALLTALAACSASDSGPHDAEAGSGEAADWSTSQSESSASSDGSTTAGASVSTSATGSDFVNVDAGPGCGEPCDIWDWGGCPDGQKCSAVACEVGSTYWDSNICVDIMGWKGVGEPCQVFGNGVDGLDDCELGSMCWNVDSDTGLGICLQFCFGSPANAQCSPGATCNQTGDGTIPACLPDCDPLAQDCDAGEICIPNYSSTAFSCAFDASGGDADYGTPCDFANACNAGLLCVTSSVVPEPTCAGAAGCCSPMCNTEVFEACPGEGQVCEPMFEAGSAPAEYEHVGVCAVPEGP